MKRGLLTLLGYTAADVVCVGVGMGVPVFCILLGFPVGWLIVGHVTAGVSDIGAVLRKVRTPDLGGSEMGPCRHFSGGAERV